MIENKKAFTLIEVLVVGIIIAVLASVAFFNFGVIFEKMKAKEAEQTLLSILAAFNSYKVEHNGQNPITLSQLGVTFPASKHFNPPSISPGLTAAGLAAQVHRTGPTVRYDYPDGSWRIETTTPYILNIRFDGTIICGSDSNNICDKMGY